MKGTNIAEILPHKGMVVHVETQSHKCYTIGSKGKFSNKVLKSLSDCVEEFLLEINNTSVENFKGSITIENPENKEDEES